MEIPPFSEIIAAIDTPIDDPAFFSNAFAAVAARRQAAQARDGDNLKRVVTEEYDAISRQIDATGVQDSAAVRNVLRTRRLANLLINDKGELSNKLVQHVIQRLQEHLYALGPERQHDTRRNQQILAVLQALQGSAELVHLLHQVSKPYLHPQADQLIRETLQLPANTVIHDAHARRAVLSAMLCTLRQNVGSCFATAPAILIHEEQREQFLIDMRELLGTGRLKRVAAGVEHTVPLSYSWGAGDLHKPLLLTKFTFPGYTPIWHAPGLLLALEAVGILASDADPRDQVEVACTRVTHAFPEWNKMQPQVLTTMEEVLQRILMQECKITADELRAFENRPRTMVHAGMMMQPSAVGSGMGGKGDACTQYYYLFERALNAFKALGDNALLRAWEYTLASFSEAKADFTRWNLYSSLGLGPEEPGGIGQCLFQAIKQKLEVCNKTVSDLQFEYEQLYAQLKQIEVHARNPSSERDAQWTRVEYQTKRHEFDTLEDMRNQMHARAQRYAQLFDMLIDHYDRLFPQYFQEVYDPELRGIVTGPYDDSPAGFRLFYKHGRSNTSQWTSTQTPEEFIENLVRFFTATENEVSTAVALEGMQNDLGEILTTVVNHIRTPEFIETAFQRMAIAHRVPPVAEPLKNLDKIVAKPWAYISGGTMTTLISSYYRLDQKPTEVARWVDNPIELLVFFIDTLKQMPYKLTKPFLEKPQRSLLMHSPTHAFLLKPGVSPFKEAWQTDAYTYTWVRDFWVRGMEQFVSGLTLDESMMEYIVQALIRQVPLNFQPYFKQVFAHTPGKLSSIDFRDYLLDRILLERGLQQAGSGVLSSDQIDSLLYAYLPLFPAHQLTARVQEILNALPELDATLKERVNEVIHLASSTPLLHSQLIGAQQLLDICGAVLCISLGTTSLSDDLMSQVQRTAHQLGYIMPAPLIFADSNWSRDAFGFVVSPGTGKLELWRTDWTGRNASPISSWRPWLDGSRKEPQWGIFTRPAEYTPAQGQGGIQDVRKLL